MQEPSEIPRLALIDICRSVALAGMIAYHFVYDLAYFGVLPPGSATHGGWGIFARIVAGSFIFISGASLYLAHRNGFRTKLFLNRLSKLVFFAASISLATYLIMPGNFVYFGILHSIAVSSCVGAIFLRAHTAVTMLSSFAAYALSYAKIGSFADYPLLVWTGLLTDHPHSMDFEPTFPWLSPFLLGLALAQAAERIGLLEPLSRIPTIDNPLVASAVWAGRHSLFIYLVHQPILMGSVFAAASLMRS